MPALPHPETLQSSFLDLQGGPFLNPRNTNGLYTALSGTETYLTGPETVRYCVGEPDPASDRFR